MAGRPGPGPSLVDVVVPVFDEALTLPRSVELLRTHLDAELAGFLEQLDPAAPAPRWRILIADNASTDDTLAVATALADRLDGVDVLHIDTKGRGAALRAAWSVSPAAYLVYMDVDLSTNLAALAPLLGALADGADLAIGSRLATGSTVVRGPRREVISRGYNLLLRAVLRTGVADAQCGFKAIRSDAAAELLPLVRDDAWFFDTELILLARRRGRRVVEIPVDWVDDPDSRVELWATAMHALAGVARMRFARQRAERPLSR